MTSCKWFMMWHVAWQENQNKGQERDLGCTYMVKDLFDNESKAPGYMVNAGQTQPFWSQKQQKFRVT